MERGNFCLNASKSELKVQCFSSERDFFAPCLRLCVHGLVPAQSPGPGGDLMECVFSKALGVDSPLLMQRRRSRGVAARAHAAAAAHQVTDWANSILRCNNIALAARGEPAVAMVMLFCLQVLYF